MGAAGKTTDSGELHACLRPLEVRIQLCTPPLEALARNFAASPVETNCGKHAWAKQVATFVGLCGYGHHADAKSEEGKNESSHAAPPINQKDCG